MWECYICKSCVNTLYLCHVCKKDVCKDCYVWIRETQSVACLRCAESR
jgi:hypothetical protein